MVNASHGVFNNPNGQLGCFSIICTSLRLKRNKIFSSKTV